MKVYKLKIKLLFGKMTLSATRRAHDENLFLFKSKSIVKLMPQRFDIFVSSRLELFLSDLIFLDACLKS